MPIYSTLLYWEDGELVVKIPLQIQPIKKIIPTTEVFEKQTEHPVEIKTVSLQPNGAMRAITPISLLQEHGFDPFNRIAIYVGDTWLESHFYHGIPSGAVWLPKKTIDRFGIKPFSTISVYIYGITPPIPTEREMQEITINHLENIYMVYERKWVIPDTTITIKGIDVKPGELLNRAITEGKVIAEWYYDTPGIVEVEFIVYPDQPEQERFLTYSNNLAFRTMGVKNYVVSKESDYSLLEETRATILTAYPRNRYFMVRPKTLTDTLNITARNMGAGLFHAKKWNKKGEQVIGKKLIEKEIITVGNEWNRPIDYAKAKEGKFQYVEKYARIVKNNKPWISLNKDVEELMTADEKGLIWRKKRNMDRR